MRRKHTLENTPTVELQRAREILQGDPKILKKKVRIIAARGDTDAYARALYTLAAGHRFGWTLDDWKAVLNRLDNCEVTVKEWIDALKAT